MKWTLNKAAAEFGFSRDTIRRGLQRLDIETGPTCSYTSRQILTALIGDKDYEQTRVERAKANLLEIEERKEAGELVEMSTVKEYLRAQFGPIREALLSAPTSLASRCNPSDPTIAREAIASWVDDTLRTLQEATLKQLPVNGRRGPGAPRHKPKPQRK